MTSEGTELEEAKKEIGSEVSNLLRQEALSIQLLLMHFDIHVQIGRIDWQNDRELSVVITSLSVDKALKLLTGLDGVTTPNVESKDDVPPQVLEVGALLEGFGITGTVVSTILYDNNNKANPVYGWAIPAQEFDKFKALISQAINASN